MLYVMGRSSKFTLLLQNHINLMNIEEYQLVYILSTFMEYLFISFVCLARYEFFFFFFLCISIRTQDTFKCITNHKHSTRSTHRTPTGLGLMTNQLPNFYGLRFDFPHQQLLWPPHSHAQVVKRQQERLQKLVRGVRKLIRNTLREIKKKQQNGNTRLIVDNNISRQFFF